MRAPWANQTKKMRTPSPELTAGCAGPESEFNTTSACQSLPTLACSWASILAQLGSVCVLCLRLFCVHPSCHQSNGSLSVVRTRPVKRQRPGPMSSRMRIKPSLLKSWTMFCNLGCGSSSFEAKSVGPSLRTSTTLLENILFCARFRDVVKKSGGPDVYLTSKYPTEA